MKYQIKERPKTIGYAVTHEFSLVDENGKELKLRKWENERESGLYKYDEEKQDWVDFYNMEVDLVVDELFYDYDWLKF